MSLSPMVSNCHEGTSRVSQRREPAEATFLISLDFELLWGMRGMPGASSYLGHILGARAAIPRILATFQEYEIRATWATVGLLLFDSRADLLRHLPAIRPHYTRTELDPYRDLEILGDNEGTDPFHYGLSLARQIVACEGMELASHTFSHYYCLEAGQTLEAFREDLDAAIAATCRITERPQSIVFPRNQVEPGYLSLCRQSGLLGFRGNEAGRLHKASRYHDISSFQRGLRLLDAHINLSGAHAFSPQMEGRMVNLPSSRFLRPFNPHSRILERLKLGRIKRAMTLAASRKEFFHLWWHPHNFGLNLDENILSLETILKHFVFLRERYGFVSRTMRDAAERAVRSS
jgi:hypothetical protein